MLVNAPAALKEGVPAGVQCMVAGAAPPASMIEGMEQLGFDLTHVYGLTETYGPVTVCPEQDGWSALDVGERARLNARQGVRYHLQQAARVINPETMQPVPQDGETMGEIMVRGNITMKGYLKNPAATEEAFRGGWFHTGDLAVQYPDGYIKIKDRSKDVIISGGENISSIEVEDVLYRHPAVLAAAVVARPDAKWGETPCAFVEAKPGATVTAEDIVAHCKKHLAGFKVPRAVVFGELPKTSTGKIQKFELRKQEYLVPPAEIQKFMALQHWMAACIFRTPAAGPLCPGTRHVTCAGRQPVCCSLLAGDLQAPQGARRAVADRPAKPCADEGGAPTFLAAAAANFGGLGRMDNRQQYFFWKGCCGHLVADLKAAIMGIVEGLTEFLPISSTGHLILVGSLLGFDDAKAKVFDIAIQTGAIFAVILVYWQKIRTTLVALPSSGQAQKFALNVLIGFLPAVVLGLLFGSTSRRICLRQCGRRTTFHRGRLCSPVGRKAPDGRGARVHDQDSRRSTQALPPVAQAPSSGAPAVANSPPLLDFAALAAACAACAHAASDASLTPAVSAQAKAPIQAPIPQTTLDAAWSKALAANPAAGFELRWARALHEVRAAGGKGSHSWYPVCRESLDNVVGLVRVAHMLDIANPKSVSVASLVVPATYVPETLNGLELLEQFRARAGRMIFVVDEYGVVQGIITPRDLLEAITGELKPGGGTEAWAVQNDDGSWYLDGLMPISELKARLEIKELPDEEKGRYNTLAGMLMAESGHMPPVGEKIYCAGWVFEVMALEGKRVDKVIARPDLGDAAY
ncbi:hypothetical protein FQA39_LY18675 [Lamprigera yunnana]|nr:hypothetical protein FQA39_LY18675 [Lamprigera yunnana]